ncbi:MAG: DUF1669 domain-containing protein [Bacteroidia bacterium]|nr:DUF1669 domain-containing protein [Bacteroidia bacterium]
MNTHQILLPYFTQAFADRKFSSSETKAIKQILREHSLDHNQRTMLLHDLFAMTEEALCQGNNREVMDWLRKANQILIDADQAVSDRSDVYFSPGHDCLNAILEAINQARKSIDICVFTISDDRISEVLIRRHLAGLPIRVISDNEKMEDQGSDIRTLSDARIPVRIDRTPNHMHHKFAIFDGESVLTGSYNWTRSAEKYNNENILITNQPRVLRKYQTAFNKMWEEMEVY